MPFFEVKTTSTFENIYLVEADNEKQAVEFALDSDRDDKYFVQKFQDEQHTDVTTIEEIWWTDWLAEQYKGGYV